MLLAIAASALCMVLVPGRLGEWIEWLFLGLWVIAVPLGIAGYISARRSVTEEPTWPALLLAAVLALLVFFLFLFFVMGRAMNL